MKMSLSQHPPLSYHCVSLKERLQVRKANERKKEKKGKSLYRDFTNTLTKGSLTCYLLLGFREPICIDMFHLWENQ